MIIGKTFEFSAAHHLPYVHDLHKCRNVHGHNYSVTVAVEGPRDADMGWVADYADLKPLASLIDNRLDHSDLNLIIDNPTAENLAVYLWHHAANILTLPPDVALVELTVQENPTSFATITADSR